MEKATTLSIAELIRLTNSGVMKSDIGLQREIIYNENKMCLVIDSILKGICLPAFYFWKKNNHEIEILDGKQRHHAIISFFQNDFKYVDKVNSENNNNNKNWKQIGIEAQKLINETKIIVIYHEGSESFKQNIFYRINSLGVPLSAFEIINGLYYGKFLSEFKSWVSHYTDFVNLMPSNTRGTNNLFLLKLLLGDKITNNNSVDAKNLKNLRTSSFIGSDSEAKLKSYIRFVVRVFGKEVNKSDGTFLKNNLTFAKRNRVIFFKLAKENIEYCSLWASKKLLIRDKLEEYYDTIDWKVSKSKYRDTEVIITRTVQGLWTDVKRFFTSDQKNMLFRREKLKHNPLKAKCKKCENVSSKFELEIDHIEPWSHGGRTYPDNAQLLCKICIIKNLISL